MTRRNTAVYDSSCDHHYKNPFKSYIKWSRERTKFRVPNVNTFCRHLNFVQFIYLPNSKYTCRVRARNYYGRVVFFFSTIIVYQLLFTIRVNHPEYDPIRKQFRTECRILRYLCLNVCNRVHNVCATTRRKIGSQNRKQPNKTE